MSTIAEFLIALAALGSFFVTWKNRHIINQIHVLVNSKMTDALREIKDLRQEVEKQKHLPAEPKENDA
jgi:hypothetical protein